MTYPEVFVGDAVLWHDGGNLQAPAYAAICVGVGQNGLIDLIAFPPMSYNGIPKSGVRHASDPDKKTIQMAEDGTWSQSKRLKKLTELQASLQPKGK